jgi:copper homeostasis protein
MILEVVVYTIDAALQAQQGGADRIELCDNPAEGGTTPSYGTIERVRKNLSIDVFVMIRPRGGDFHYSAEEFECMKADIEQCKRLKVEGVVLGILHTDGTIDKKRCKELIELARPMSVTCHRAFDMTMDSFQALEDCIDIGFDRILTSGRHTKAIEGIEILTELVFKANSRIIILPGSGVTVQNAATLASQTGAKELHFSAMALQESPMKFKNPLLTGMGSNKGTEFNLRTVDPTVVRDIRAALNANKPLNL